MIAETFGLLSDVFGPYCFTVAGSPGDQQAVFKSAAEHTLFSIRLYEFVAQATDVYSGGGAPKTLSLLEGGLWLVKCYPEEAANAGLDASANELMDWLNRNVRVRFWFGELDAISFSMSPLRRC